MFFPRLLAVILAALFCVAPATTPAAAQDIIIRGAEVFDGTSDRVVLADIAIHNGRIMAVGKNLPAPKEGTVIDGKGMTALPGLFDLHTHWGPFGRGAKTKPEIAAAYLRAGVTTVNDFAQAPEAFLPLRNWYSTLTVPHVRFAARVTSPLGHGAEMWDQNMTAIVESPAGGVETVRNLASYNPDLIKVFQDGWRYGRYENMASMDTATLHAITQEAKKHNLSVVTHTVTVAHGIHAAAAGVTAVVHMLQDRPLDDKAMAFLKKYRMPVVPTLAVYEPEGWRPKRTDVPPVRFDGALANVKRLIDGGIPIGVGTDSGISRTVHGNSTLRELVLLVTAGLSPTQALKAATSTSATISGVEADRGTIEAGKRADIVLVKGRPWKNILDIYNKKTVILDGKVVVDRGADQLPAADAATFPPAVSVASLIDDFERSDGRSALDTLRFHYFDNAFERSKVSSKRVVRDGGGHAIRVDATMAQKDGPYAGLVIPLSRGAVHPVDLKPYSGVSFDVRGDGELVFRMVGYRGVQHATFTTGGAWQTVRIPLVDLAASRKSAEQADDLIHQIEFIGYRPARSRLWFEIDNVKFY